MIYFRVALAVFAAAIMGMTWWRDLNPKPPFVYHYQWPGRWAHPDDETISIVYDAVD